MGDDCPVLPKRQDAAKQARKMVEDVLLRFRFVHNSESDAKIIRLRREAFGFQYPEACSDGWPPQNCERTKNAQDLAAPRCRDSFVSKITPVYHCR